MSPEQVALVMELSAAIGAELRPPADDAAARRRERDKSYQAQKRAERRQKSAESADDNDATPLPLPPNDNNSNPPTPTPENTTPREREAADAHVTDWLAWFDKHPFPRPHWSEARLWADLLKNRKTKRLTNTVTAYVQLLEKAADLAKRTGWPPGEVLRSCVAKGWGAIFETDQIKAAINGHGNGNNRRQSPGHHGGRDNRDGFKRACDDWIDEAERSAVSGNGAGGQLALGGPGAL